MRPHPLLFPAVALFAASLPAQTARFTTSGVGCPAPASPTLNLLGTPLVGGTATLQVSGLPADAAFPIVTIGGTQANTPLGMLGATGCSGLVGNIFVATGMTLSSPTATARIAMPSSPDSLGVTFHVQAVALSPASNPFGFAASNRGSLTMGSTATPRVLPYGGAVLNGVSGITPVITISRTSGAIPCVVQATAVASSATWVNPATLVPGPLPNPYDQLHYRWDFGDGSGDEFMKNPVTGKLVDPDVDQTGPQGTFIYRRPGTYTITLTASVKNHSGVLTRAHTTVFVTVSDFEGQTRYFDPEKGDDANDGLTSTTPKRSWAAYSHWVTGGDGRRALLRRGTTLVQMDRLVNDRSHTRVEPYGVGSDPIIEAGPNFQISTMLDVDATHFLEDQVYSGIVLRGMGRARGVVRAYGEDDPAARDVVFMDCTFENSMPEGRNLVALTGDHLSRFTFWDCDFRHNDAPGHGLYSHLHSETSPQEFLSVMGGSFLGGDGRPVLDHHIYDSGWRRYDLLRWIDFGPAITKNFCLNMDTGHSNGNNVEYILIDGCDVTGTSNGIDASNGPNNPAIGQFDHFIIQNTAVHDGDPATGYGVFGYAVRRLVIRDSFFYGNPRSDFRIEDPSVNYRVYRNIFWRDTNGNTTPGMRLLPGQRGSFTDNVFEVASNPGFNQRIFRFHASEAANYTFTGNQYWSPHLISGGQVTPFLDSGTSQNLTMGQWLVLFPNDGPYADPGFIDPANGIF